MMNTNSPSEQIWELLHLTKAALDDGFADDLPPMPEMSSSNENSEASPIESRARNEAWPSGIGSGSPQAVLFSAAPLSDQALAFVRSWFENPRVSLTLAADLFVQPLPALTGSKPPYAELAAELCSDLRPKAVLSLGAVPAQKILGAPLSLDTLRSSDYRFGRWSIITTLDPEEFPSLNDDEAKRFKAQIWKDLQRLLGKLRYG
jgi:hypothetical protein